MTQLEGEPRFSAVPLKEVFYRYRALTSNSDNIWPEVICFLMSYLVRLSIHSKLIVLFLTLHFHHILGRSSFRKIHKSSYKCHSQHFTLLYKR